MLANALSIDGRKEWTCKFCSESNVWTRWRCRRCYNNIPAGLAHFPSFSFIFFHFLSFSDNFSFFHFFSHFFFFSIIFYLFFVFFYVSSFSHGKCRQALAAKSAGRSTVLSASSGEEDRKTRSLEAESKEVRARIDAMEKKEGAQKGAGIPFKEDGDLEEVWGDCMKVEDEAECRRKLDEQRKKLQKEPREVGSLYFIVERRRMEGSYLKLDAMQKVPELVVTR